MTPALGARVNHHPIARRVTRGFRDKVVKGGVGKVTPPLDLGIRQLGTLYRRHADEHILASPLNLRKSHD